MPPESPLVLLWDRSFPHPGTGQTPMNPHPPGDTIEDTILS